MNCNHTILPAALMSLAAWLLILAPTSAGTPASADLEALQEKAMKAAVLRVAPSVVQITTSGGTDLVGSGPMGPQIRKGAGPTTGLVVAPDGYIISSAFNFVNKPSEIFAFVPGHKERYVAKVVATDQTRMLTLLKVDASGLPVPQAAPRKQIKIGQWAVALGRTWSSGEGPPSVSVGIISATDRIWGKAIQTDAKISPVNYGGPLVDIHGRVQGVLVPASPQGDDETAGVEWYDSGIGFAIPLEDIYRVLPRLKEGQDLRRGLLGVRVKNPEDLYSATPVVDTVAPDSAAAHAGIKPGDAIIDINGQKITRQAEIQHALGNKYDGDLVSVKIKRGPKEIDLPNLKLTGILTAFIQPFLGILPMRDDPELGVEVRYIFPKSAAESAGVKPGDRILTIGPASETPKAFSGRDQFLTLLNTLLPGMEVKLEVRRKGAKEIETLTLKLASLGDPRSDTIPAELPESATFKRALEPRKTVKPAKPPAPAKKEAPKNEAKKESKKKFETGLLKRTNAASDHDYWVYVPENYDPNIAHALVVWLHAAGRGKERDAEAMVSIWAGFCEDHHLILVGPKAENETGWLFNEADALQETIKSVISQYTIDRQRVIVHGMGIGGQMAFYLGFRGRDLIRGVATTGSVLAGKAQPNVVGRGLSFYMVAGGKDPLAQAIADTRDKLIEQKFPVIYRKVDEMGTQYLDDEKTFLEMIRWIDSLDRL